MLEIKIYIHILIIEGKLPERFHFAVCSQPHFKKLNIKNSDVSISRIDNWIWFHSFFVQFKLAVWLCWFYERLSALKVRTICWFQLFLEGNGLVTLFMYPAVNLSTSNHFKQGSYLFKMISSQWNQLHFSRNQVKI